MRAVLRIVGGALLGALSGMLVALPAALLADLFFSATFEAGRGEAFSLGLTALAFGADAGGAAGVVIALMLEAVRRGRFSKRALTVGSLATVGIWILYGLWTMQSLSSAGYPGAAGFFWLVVGVGVLWTIMATLFVRPRVVRAMTARWWLRGALLGLVIGWVFGLVVVRPGADDLLDTALDLVPTSAEVTHAAISGADFQLIDFTGPPSAWVEVTTDLTPEELTEDFEETASAQGWTVLPRIRHPGAIEVPLRSLLLTGKASSVVRGDDSGPLPGPDARINVRRHDWTGKVVTGMSSIAGALVGGVLAWYMFGRLQEGETKTQPLRWWHWVGLIVLATIWLLALSVIG